VHVCREARVSSDRVENGQELMLGHELRGARDPRPSGATAGRLAAPRLPHFRLAGPENFDLRLASNEHGDNCIALLGNTAVGSGFPNLMGDRSYQVKPTEQVVFQEGRVRPGMSNDVVPLTAVCAAPLPRCCEPLFASHCSAPFRTRHLPANVHLPLR